MDIKTKFKIGEEVYIIFKEEHDGLVRLFKDKVTEIVISNEPPLYYGEIMCEEFREEELVSIHNNEELIKRIEKLTNEGNE